MAWDVFVKFYQQRIDSKALPRHLASVWVLQRQLVDFFLDEKHVLSYPKKKAAQHVIAVSVVMWDCDMIYTTIFFSLICGIPCMLWNTFRYQISHFFSNMMYLYSTLNVHIFQLKLKLIGNVYHTYNRNKLKTKVQSNNHINYYSLVNAHDFFTEKCKKKTQWTVTIELKFVWVQT